MRYKPQYSNRFKRQYKKLLHSGNQRALKALQRTITLLASGNSLSPSYRNHQLIGTLKEFSECHVLPDWLLVYRIYEEVLILELIATGTHSELFG